MIGGSKLKIDFEAIRLSNSTSEIGTHDLGSDIRLCKPNKQSFFRVHPDPEYRIQMPLLYYNDERKWFFVSQTLWSHFSEEFNQFHLITCMDVSGTPFIWPIKPLNPTRPSSWTMSALEAVDKAVHQWTRIVADMNQGRYRIKIAVSNQTEPNWPEMSFEDIVTAAFSQSHIDSLDHPIAKKLRGEK